MKQYIDKSAVIAKIRSLQDSTMDKDGNFYTAKAQAEYNVLYMLESFLNALEVKEMDEEPVSKDLKAEFVLYLKHKFNIPQERNKLKTNGWNPSPYDLLDIAKHFAQWQKEQMITKACEWLKENKDHPLIGCEDPCLSGYLTDEFIEEFKKAMEE